MGHAKPMQDGPRLFSDPSALAEREKHLDDEHVAPLNEWVRDLRQRLGSSAIVPWFDPGDGGIRARILWLLEAPGPKATRQRGGSGIVSCNNNDGTAQNTWKFRAAAGVTRDLVVHWNAIPYYLGSETRIRAHARADVAAVGPLLRELLELLPDLSVVILGGRAAQDLWRGYAPQESAITPIECPHPSPTNVNTRPGTREQIIEAWRSGVSLLVRRP